ncbi:MAG TPA: hypothetical protein VIM52_03380, partial [Stellaceae bacterium]
MPEVKITFSSGAFPLAQQQLNEEIDRLKAEGKRIFEIGYPQHAGIVIAHPADFGMGGFWVGREG